MHSSIGSKTSQHNNTQVTFLERSSSKDRRENPVITHSKFAHRLPISKRDIRQMQFDQEQIMMFKKIRGAKSHIDNVSKIKHLCPPDEARRLKYKQMGEDRNIEVQRENRRLLENITKIICSGRGKSGHMGMRSRQNSRQSLHSSRSRSGSQMSARGAVNEYSHSLNAEYNLRKQQKIELENSRILARLASTKGMIDVSEFTAHQKQHKVLSKNISSQQAIPCAFYNQFQLNQQIKASQRTQLTPLRNKSVMQRSPSMSKSPSPRLRMSQSKEFNTSFPVSHSSPAMRDAASKSVNNFRKSMHQHHKFASNLYMKSPGIQTSMMNIPQSKSNLNSTHLIDKGQKLRSPQPEPGKKSFTQMHFNKGEEPEASTQPANVTSIDQGSNEELEQPSIALHTNSITDAVENGISSRNKVKKTMKSKRSLEAATKANNPNAVAPGGGSSKRTTNELQQHSVSVLDKHKPSKIAMRNAAASQMELQRITGTKIIALPQLNNHKAKLTPLVVRNRFGDKEFESRTVLYQMKTKIDGSKYMVEFSQSHNKCYISAIKLGANNIFSQGQQAPVLERFESVMQCWEKQFLKTVNILNSAEQAVAYTDAALVPISELKVLGKALCFNRGQLCINQNCANNNQGSTLQQQSSIQEIVSTEHI